MASCSSKLVLLRRVSKALRIPPPSLTQTSHIFTSHYSSSCSYSLHPSNPPPSRSFCSSPSIPSHDSSQGPAPIDYHSVLEEDEFHNLADSTINSLLEKIEEYGDSVEIDGFDIDYGNQVLTVKLGNFGTYVLNKQTPNRQIWMSSPVSGPSRFDWDRNTQAWVYRRNKANLLEILEIELEKLCRKPISLS